MELVQLSRRPDLRGEKEALAGPGGGLVLGKRWRPLNETWGGNILRLETMN